MAMSVTDEQQRPVDAGAVTVGPYRYLRAPVPVDAVRDPEAVIRRSRLIRSERCRPRARKATCSPDFG